MSDGLLAEVQAFLVREARLADEHRYDDWEALWTGDGVYWIPANGDDIDPETQMSIVYDNRSRIALRIRQLKTGKHHTQAPQSRLRRIVSNVEILHASGDSVTAAADSMIFESNQRGDAIWAARTEYVLRRAGNSFRIARKKVMLVNNDKALYTLSFLV